MGNENINLGFTPLDLTGLTKNLGITFKTPELVSQLPTETELEPVIEVENQAQFTIIDSFGSNLRLDPDTSRNLFNSVNSDKIVNPSNTDWNNFNVIPANEEYGKTLDERLNDLKNLKPLEITSETSVTDIQNYKKLLEDSKKTVQDGISQYGRLGNNLSLLNANRNLLSLESDYNKQIEALKNQEGLSAEKKAELNELSLNPRNNTSQTNSANSIDGNSFTGNGEGTWFSNQSDRSIYTTIVTAAKEAKITADHKDQLAVAAVIENRGESSRWNPGGKSDGEAISRQPNQFVAINGLGNINSEDDAVKALAKKFGSTDAARQYVQYMYQTLKNGSEEYSEVQDWLRGKDSFRSANSHNYNGTPLIAGGNRYGW